MAATEEIKTASITAGAGVDTTIVPAVTGKRIRVLSYVLVVDGATPAAVTWKSGAAAPISGGMLFADGGGAAVVAPVGERMPNFLLQTNVGQALVLNCGAATTAAGHLTYQEVA